MAGIAVAGTRLFHGYASKVLPSKSLQTSLIRCYDTNKAASAKPEGNATLNKGYFGSIIANAAARITPAVVHLYAQQGQGENLGSGAVIHKDGYILTCSDLLFNKTDVIRSSNGEVIKGSPAFRAGIQACDVVMEFDGKRVRDITEMMNAMGERSGKPVELLVKRARDGRDASVRLTITFQEKVFARL